jgi:hypothetical protein
MADREEFEARRSAAVRGVMEAKDKTLDLLVKYVNDSRSKDMGKVSARFDELTHILNDLLEKLGQVVVSIHNIEAALITKLGVDPDVLAPEVLKKRKRDDAGPSG